MNWGFELWDQFDNVDKHHQQGIEFVEKYAKFVKERISVEQDYASKLRKLVKSYQPKKRHEDRTVFSSYKAFQSQLSELNDVAGQHEIVAENMLSRIVNVCTNTCTEMKQEKKKYLHDGKRLQSELDNLERHVDQCKKKFEKEWKESERLQANYERLDADCNATKADVEKARNISLSKKDSVEHCKTDYGASLVRFNETQKKHFEEEMPKVFESYRLADKSRVEKLQELMLAYAGIETSVQPIIQKCLDGMKQSADAINSELDAEFVVERLKSGFPIPGDKEFEDYTAPNHNPVTGSGDGGSGGGGSGGAMGDSPRNSALNPNKNRKGGFGWLFGAKKVAESPDFSHLPPEQRKKRLQAKIAEIKKEMKKVEEGRNGLVRMQEVYKSNANLGNPSSVQPQIDQATSELDKLQAQLHQHETWLAEATGKTPPARPTPPKITSSSGGGESNNHQIPPPPPLGSSSSSSTPAPDHRSIDTPTTTGADDVVTDDNEFDDVDPVGTCEALYDYEASSEGEMSMTAGDQFQVLEADSGDGWTRVMNEVGDGYVPTTYIDIKFFY